MWLLRFFRLKPKRLPLVQNLVTDALRAKMAAPIESQFLAVITELRNRRD